MIPDNNIVKRRWKQLSEQEAVMIVLAGDYVTTEFWLEKYGFLHISQWPSDIVVKADGKPIYWRWNG